MDNISYFSTEILFMLLLYSPGMRTFMSANTDQVTDRSAMRHRQVYRVRAGCLPDGVHNRHDAQDVDLRMRG